MLDRESVIATAARAACQQSGAVGMATQVGRRYNPGWYTPKRRELLMTKRREFLLLTGQVGCALVASPALNGQWEGLHAAVQRQGGSEGEGDVAPTAKAL
jgi:hypothetical protein